MQNAPDGKLFQCHDGVTKLSACSLRVNCSDWNFAESNAAAIDEYWLQMQRSNPAYFNGVIHLVDAVTIAGGALEASLLRTDFKSYLYWRAQGFPPAGVLDGFGSALIRSNDGHIILGRQRSGNVNGGLAYCPAGFIDAQDVDADGLIHIDQSAIREAVEETGIEPEALVREEGFYLTRSGTQLSFAVPFRATISTKEFVLRAESHIAASDHAELDGVIPVIGPRDVEGLPMPPYMRTLLDALFAEG
jgi:8-oxo-dGTP pyrophosphatase MutT (NUDIX family)